MKYQVFLLNEVATQIYDLPRPSQHLIKDRIDELQDGDTKKGSIRLPIADLLLIKVAGDLKLLVSIDKKKGIAVITKLFGRSNNETHLSDS